MDLLPERLLLGALPKGTRRPNYLGTGDRGWLEALLQEYTRFAGRPFMELNSRLFEPLPVAAPPARLRQARHVLDRLCTAPPKLKPPPRALRRALFVAAGSSPSRSAALTRAAQQLQLPPELIERHLLADLPSERAVIAPPVELNAGELALRVNLALAQGLLARALHVELALWGNARDVVRLAHLRGLLCIARAAADDREAPPHAVLELSGPLSLFRRTTVYGRALSSLLPRLALCPRFELRALCALADRALPLLLKSGDPIFPAQPPKPFDSKLEARFARDFAKAAPDWDLVREPAPLVAGERLIFPDFALVHRRDPARRHLLEIVGFWTAAYLRDKLAGLRAARVDDLILCLDADRNCGPDELPPGARVILYRKRVDPQAVLAVLG